MPTVYNKINCPVYKRTLCSLLKAAEKQHYIDKFLQYRNNLIGSWKILKATGSTLLCCFFIDRKTFKDKQRKVFAQADLISQLIMLLHPTGRLHHHLYLKRGL